MFDTVRRRHAPPVPRVTIVVLLAAAAVGSILGACSSTSSESQPVGEEISEDRTVSGTADSPCDLLSVDTIDRITGWTLPEGTRLEERELDGWSYCNWEDLDVGGSVQVQWRTGDGRASFEQRRAELEDSSVGDTRDVDVAGADAAYDVADHGVVGVLVGDHFVQVSAIGPSLDDHQHLELAEAVAIEVDR